MFESMEDEFKEINLSEPFDSVKLRVWRGCVKVIVRHANKELVLDVPRLTYFALTFAKLREYFELDHAASVRLVTQSERVAGENLSPSLPVGLLYDLLAYDAKTWYVDIQVTNNSELGISPSDGHQDMNQLRFTMWNSLKESESLRRYSIRRVQNLTPTEAEDLYSSMLRLEFVEFANRAKTLMTTEDMRFVPLRLYLTTQNALQDLLPTRTDGEKSTIKHALERLVPDFARLGADVVDVILHGVVIDWHLELKALLEEAAYVDGWLYLTIKLSRRVEQRVAQEQGECTASMHQNQHEFADQFT